MANDKQIESHHRKHHRSSSSSDDTEKASKRHKHRHHKHHHHRHRHHRDKKHENEIPSAGDETEILDVTPAAPIVVSNGCEEEDVEEGEILEEDGIGDVLMKTADSDGESGEIKFEDNNLPPLGEKGRQGEEKSSNGVLTRESEREDKRWDKEAGGPSERVSKLSYDNGRSSFSPSNSRQSNEGRARSRSKSHDRERETSRSRFAEDEFSDRGRHHDSSRDYHHDRVDSVRTEERYHRPLIGIGERRGKEIIYGIEPMREVGVEIEPDREKYISSDVDYGEMRHKQSRNTRYDAVDDLEMRKPNSLKAHNSKGDKLEETWANDERSRNEDGQDDNDEGLTWKSPEEEEEELLNRIKEESRKRMEAILEKHKRKPEQQNELLTQDNGKDVVPETGAPVSTSPAVVIAANVGQAKTNLDFDTVAAKAPLIAGGPPTMSGISDSEKNQAQAGLGEGSPKSERSADMFHDDIFGESPAGIRKVGGKGDGVPMVRSGLHDNWDDAEGYYSYQFGELLDGRYEVIATHGKGVFSTVVRAKDLKAGPAEPEEVAIKIIRNNETMHKAGKIEVQILKKLAGADREDRRHCVRFLSSFKYRNHLCLVFESLHLNLREVLKKFGRNIGLQLSAVRAYSKQLFIALKHLKNCGVLHCDIKPDNMLVNEGKNVLKLCDFGNAMFAGKNEVTPYLVSRFYRSPEIILGLTYDHPLDIWSVGCCLYELYSGKVLFPGATNNDMLRLHMELKGPFPKKMLRKGAFIDQHFDHDLNFYATEEDTVSGKLIKRMIVNVKPKDFGSIIKGYPGEDPKILAHFRDLLDKMFILDPERRLTVSQALAHPFITGSNL
ncbi:unnamed protein product [Arabidopsis thaliana]|uniref:Serine/threonine-protein kinase PRP4 homolog n=1 Tax=Arabidopsis thaliana TaxID=3702 RepID=A0A7G2ET27_ARATH|nr:unnamed protein product [Arabidopsis thaliana]